ncbi:hypothetical protein G6F54_014060 [Rhizopus delemar]|nr:hypothetical protein G6F54_014060 [Rhizopus delemar]
MPRPSPSGADSRRPFWSTIDTFSAVSSGTLEATSHEIADTWASLRLRPGWTFSSTDAVGAWRSRTNSDWRGMARFDLLSELAGAEAGVVHQLETDRAATRKPL